ncbi:discoidin domain-containing protein, partial [Lysobacter sp. 2RAB21]
LQALPLDPSGPYTGTASASTADANGAAANAVDGKPDTAWRARFDAAQPPQLVFDLGRKREFGGAILRWADDA